jgi:quercetin dioxygenase-like cupin family protein
MLPRSDGPGIWSDKASVGDGPDPSIGPIKLPPPRHGTRIRFVDIPPDTADSPHSLMHRTESVDYGIVVSGEMTLILDKGETLLREGDVVIQRGTNHAWANRSGTPCRMLFILVDGRFESGIPGAREDS